MKLTLFKTLIFTLYFATLAIVWVTPGLFDGFSLLFVVFTLAYCGIIVLSQLGSALVALIHWCVAANREEREATFSAPSVAFETETEAT
jgi:hypothetical protein